MLSGDFSLRRGAIFGFAQAAFAAIAQLLALRILIASSSLEALGIWALASAFCAPLRIADVAGLSTAYFVARANANSASDSDIAQHIQVCAIASLLLLIAAAALLALALPAAVALLLPKEQLEAVTTLLPLVILSTVAFTWGNGIATNYDGMQQSYLRSAILTVGSVVFLATIAIFVPRYGVFGMAAAQFAQGMTAAALSIGGLSRKFDLFTAPAKPVAAKLFGEVLRYGVRQQASNATQGLFEPALRILLSNFGGLSLVASYEVAQRVLAQGRALALQSLYPIIPAITHLQQRDTAELQQFLKKAQAWCTLAAILALPISLLASPLVQRIVIGHRDPAFTSIFASLLTPTLFAIAAFPLHYLGPATANFRWNSAFQLLALGGLLPLAAALASGLDIKAGIAIAAALTTAAIAAAGLGNATSARVPLVSHVQLLTLALIFITGGTLIAGDLLQGLLW